jgi:hypothetical protein
VSVIASTPHTDSHYACDALGRRIAASNGKTATLTLWRNGAVNTVWQGMTG